VADNEFPQEIHGKRSKDTDRIKSLSHKNSRSHETYGERPPYQ
jgi:hypothetical protein